MNHIILIRKCYFIAAYFSPFDLKSFLNQKLSSLKAKFCFYDWQMMFQFFQMLLGCNLPQIGKQCNKNMNWVQGGPTLDTKMRRKYPWIFFDSDPYVFKICSTNKFNIICHRIQLLVSGSQGPISKVPCVRVLCPRTASPKFQVSSSRVPGSRVLGSQVIGSGVLVSQVLILDYALLNHSFDPILSLFKISMLLP